MSFTRQIKLVPGKMKKGKACTQAQRIFLATSRDVARDTISALPRTRPKVEGGGIVSKADATSSRDAEYVDHEAIRQRLDEVCIVLAFRFDADQLLTTRLSV